MTTTMMTMRRVMTTTMTIGLLRQVQLRRTDVDNKHSINVVYNHIQSYINWLFDSNFISVYSSSSIVYQCT